MPISWLDVILIVIMLISGFLAMVRGFTREVLSIFSWAVAAVAALYLTPKYASVLDPYIDNPSVAQIAFAAGVFIITLIVVSLITFRISDRVLDSRVGALDRTLGFVFGLARGFLLGRHRLYSVQRACPRPARVGPQCALLFHSPADAGRHRIAAPHESGAVSAWAEGGGAARRSARGTT